MKDKAALQTVISHLNQLAVQARQIGADVNVRRECIDRYFFADSSNTECAIEARPVEVAGRPAYWLVPEGVNPDRRLLYIHGGSWMSGSIAGYRPLAARLAQACQCALLFVDYSLAPEHPYPAGLNDCVNVYQWLRQHGPGGVGAARQCFIGGDSAGGNLTLATLLACKAQQLLLPDAALAISPCTDFTASGASMESRRQVDPIILPEAIALLSAVYLQGGQDLKDPLISPLYGDLSGLPPLLLQTGDAEVLLDDSTRFAERARAVGVDVTLDIWPDMPHVFQGFAPLLPEAVEAISKIGEFFNRDF